MTQIPVAVRLSRAAVAALLFALAALSQTLPPAQLPPGRGALPPGFGGPPPAPKQTAPPQTAPPARQGKPSPATPATNPPATGAAQPAGSAAASGSATGSAPAPAPTVYGDLSLQGASLREVIDTLARELKINFILDPRVDGRVTLNTYGDAKDIDTKTLLDLLLRINGAAMVRQGNVFRIVPLGDLSRMPMTPQKATSSADITNDDAPMLNLVFLKYATVEELSKVLEPFVGEGARIIAYPPANLLFILDSRRSMRRTMDLIAMFDSDTMANQRVRLFDIKNARPSDLAQELDRILKSISLTDKNAAVKFLPVDRINTLVAIAPNPGVFDTVKTWIDKLDIPLKSSGTATDNYVYRLKYQRAECVAMIVQQLYGALYLPPGMAGAYGMGYGMGYGGYGGAYGGGYGGFGAGLGAGGAGGFGGYQSIGGANAGLGVGAGCGGASGMMGMGGGFGGGYGGGYGAGVGYGGYQTYAPGMVGAYAGYAPQYGTSAPAGVVTAPAAPGAPGSSDATGSYLGNRNQAAADVASMPRVVPNSMDNTILIQGTPSQYASILKLLRAMDIPPRQILLEAKIYEVTLGNGFSTGLTAKFLQLNPGQSSGTKGFLGGALEGAATTFSLATVVHNSKALLDYIVTDSTSRTKLVQAPSLIATDSIPASLTVGSEVPILTAQAAGSVQNGGTSQVTQQIAQKTTGVTLNVMAHVNPSGIVTLVVNQDISAPSPSVSGAVSGQSFSKRNVQTQLTMEDGDTIAIGGIILESTDNSSSGLPGLHRIPVLGAAFGSKSYSKTRTEMIVFLTPRVIFDNTDLHEASDELKERLKKLRRTVSE